MFDGLPNAFVFEIVQLVLAMAGMAISFINLRDCNEDSKALSLARINGRSLAVAKKNIVNARFAFHALLFLSMCGVWMTLADPPPPFSLRGGNIFGTVERTAVIAEMMILGITIILFLKSSTQKLLRMHVMRKIDAALLDAERAPTPTEFLDGDTRSDYRAFRD